MAKCKVCGKTVPDNITVLDRSGKPTGNYCKECAIIEAKT